MFLQVDFKSGLPVYLQMMEQIKAAAASGVLRTGDPLPGIRPLAEQLRVNRNTVAKAYAELEAEGVIETLAGKGCFLKKSQSPYKKQVRDQLLADKIDAAVVQAHHLRVSHEDFLALVRERLEDFNDRRARSAETKSQD